MEISADDALPEARSDKSLQPMLKIEWERGTNLPQGFQDSMAESSRVS
jgi:hypothetical protein